MKMIICIIIMQIAIVFLSTTGIAYSQRVQNNKDSLILEEAFIKKDTSTVKAVLDNWAKESGRKKAVIHSKDEQLVYAVYRKFMDNFLSNSLEGFNSFYFSHARYIFLQTTIDYSISKIFADASVVGN